MQAETVVHAAAGFHRRFFKGAQAGRGFARVENLRLRPANGFDEAARERGDAGEPLQKIQRDALAGEDRAHKAADFEHGVARRDFTAVVAENRDMQSAVHARESFRSRLHAGDDRRFLRYDPRATALIFGHEKFARHVTSADVLGERGGDGIGGIAESGLRIAESHAARASSIENRKSKIEN